MNKFPPIPDCENININSDISFDTSVDEPLLDVCKELGDKVYYRPVYFEKGYPGSTNKCLARSSVIEHLAVAIKLLPKDYSFLIFDAWRPYSVQRKIYDLYFSELRNRCEYKHLSNKEVEIIVKRFVSIPSKDPHRPYVHGTGGAIDLTIVDKSGMMIEMGTDFDDFSPEANTSYFEHISTKDTMIRDNRRMLYSVMTQSNFVNLPSEWWHYDYGDHIWASIYRRLPFYKVIYS